MNAFTRSGAAAAAAALALTLAACGSTDSSAPAAATSTAAATPAVTGSATEATGTMSSSMASGPSASSPASTSSADAASTEHNATDLTFAQSMIVHHQGAIEMADMAATRAASQQVKDLAARIKAAQGPEIEQMQAWLAAWGAAMSTLSEASEADDSTGGMDHGGMDHGGMSGGTEGDGSTGAGMSMPGMMTDEQMQQLTAASGAAFDKMFLEMMIEHHRGAIEMADSEIAGGTNPEALALAESIKISQTAEISEMEQLLQTR